MENTPIKITPAELEILMQAQEILTRHQLDKTTNANVTQPYSEFIQKQAVERPISDMLELTCNPLALVCEYHKANGKDWQRPIIKLWYCPGVPKFFYAETKEQFYAAFKKYYGENPVAGYDILFAVDINHTENDVYFDLEADGYNDAILPPIDGTFIFEDDGKGGKKVTAELDITRMETELAQEQLGNEDDLLAKVAEFGYEYLSRNKGNIADSVFS